tara:strand:+ start:862 stop:2550 length:1689 start_codon:yes stop_codon:yes gene_type:complete
MKKQNFYYIQLLILLFLSPFLISKSNASDNEDINKERNEIEVMKWFAQSHFSVNPNSSFLKRYLPEPSVNLKKVTVGIKVQGNLIGSGFLFKRENDLYTVITSKNIFTPFKKEDNIEIITSDGNIHISNKINHINGLDISKIQFETEKNYETGKFKKLPTNLNAGLKCKTDHTSYFNRGLFNIGIIGLTSDNNPTYVVNSGNLIANSKGQTKNGYQLITSIRSKPSLKGGPIFDRKGFIVGMHSNFDKNKRISQVGKHFTGISQAIPIAILFQNDEIVKNKNFLFLQEVADCSINHVVMDTDIDRRQVTLKGGVPDSRGFGRFGFGGPDQRKCTSEYIKPQIDRSPSGIRYFNYGIYSDLNECHRSIAFTDKEIVEALISDESYENSLHKIINEIYTVKKTYIKDKNKKILKPRKCMRKVLDRMSPTYLLDSLEAQDEYDKCKEERKKRYNEELTNNKLTTIQDGINNTVLPTKLVNDCILLDDLKYIENINVPNFINCLYKATDVAYLTEVFTTPYWDFWEKDYNYTKLCKTFTNRWYRQTGELEAESKECLYHLSKDRKK